MARLSTTRSTSMAASVSIDADDVSFAGDPAHDEPTVDVDGAFNLGGDWILRRYTNESTEQVLYLERKKTAPPIEAEAMDVEAVRDVQQEAALIPGPSGSSWKFDKGAPKMVTDRKENLERINPNRPGTRGNSSAGIDGTRPDRRAKAPSLPQIPESPEQERSASPQDEEVAKLPKRKASTKANEAQAGRKKARAVKTDQPISEKKKPGKNRQPGTEHNAKNSRVSEAPVVVGFDEADNHSAKTFSEMQLDHENHQEAQMHEMEEGAIPPIDEGGGPKKKSKLSPEEDKLMADGEVSESAAPAKKKPAAKPKPRGSKAKKVKLDEEEEEDQQKESTSEDDSQDIEVPFKSEEEPGDNIIVEQGSKRRKK